MDGDDGGSMCGCGVHKSDLRVLLAGAPWGRQESIVCAKTDISGLSTWPCASRGLDVCRRESVWVVAVDLALEKAAKKQAAKKRQKVGKKPQKGEKEEYARKNLRRTQLLMKRPKIDRRAEEREGLDSDFSEDPGGDEEEEMQGNHGGEIEVEEGG